jgi:hypothetical protein
MGAVLDRFGPRWNSVLGALLFGAGCITFSMGIVRPCKSSSALEVPAYAYRSGYISHVGSQTLEGWKKLTQVKWFLARGAWSTCDLSRSIPP